MIHLIIMVLLVIAEMYGCYVLYEKFSKWLDTKIRNPILKFVIKLIVTVFLIPIATVIAVLLLIAIKSIK
jgi:hypothetical protein